ncbi:MAG TPA: amidohydrolase family protein [Verrucomicrobiae bacterium]|jgi:imidazolonepropionase-like amidohydrolase|nr:amidohydrolase family protein [Verrucomicrobiae bacterium]
MATTKTTPELMWVRCDGYFSGAIHSDPHWIGVDADGRISAIRQTPPPGAEAVQDARRRFAIPLLADTHVHFYMQPYPVAPADRTTPGSQPFENEVVDAIVRVKLALAEGVGFLRDLGDPRGINLEVRSRLAGDAASVPELQVAGAGIHRPKKYGRFLGVMRESIPEIKKTIDQFALGDQVDFIKLVTTGIVSFEEMRVKQTPQFTVAELTELVEFAHAKGKKVAAHCSGPDGLDCAIAAEVDFIEHAYFITEPQLRQLAEKGLFWTPTLAPVAAQGFEPEAGWNAEVRRNIAEILDTHNRMIALGFRNGAKILAGTDAGSPGVAMGRGLRAELNCLARSGLRPDELLTMATETAARACGAKRYTGRIAVGEPASFGLYAEPPWESVTNLNSLQEVYSHGTRISPAFQNQPDAVLNA